MISQLLIVFYLQIFKQVFWEWQISYPDSWEETSEKLGRAFGLGCLKYCYNWTSHKTVSEITYSDIHVFLAKWCMLLPPSKGILTNQNSKCVAQEINYL